VIASDVGEISNMLENEAGLRGGIVVKSVRETEQFIAAFAEAMETVLDRQLREDLSRNAHELGRRYDMEPLVEIYSGLYTKVLNKKIAVATLAG